MVGVVHHPGRRRDQRHNQHGGRQQADADTDVAEDEHSVAAPRQRTDQQRLALQPAAGTGHLASARPHCLAEIDRRRRGGRVEKHTR